MVRAPGYTGRVALRCVWLGVEGLGGIENSQAELHAPGLLHAVSHDLGLAGGDLVAIAQARRTRELRVRMQL